MKYNWKNIDYLKTGNTKQKKVYDIIVESKILKILEKFSPALVSTICVELDIDSSDLDIICSTDNLSKLEKVFINNFSNMEKFKIWYRTPENKEIICSFIFKNFEFEIFGSLQSIEKQNAYKHLTIMKRLVDIGGGNFINPVREYKKAGLKTEPAIAKLLNLKGNPYEAVLKLSKYTDRQLRKKVFYNHTCKNKKGGI